MNCRLFLSRPSESAPKGTHHVHILEVNGDSYRLKQSKRKQKSQPAST